MLRVMEVSDDVEMVAARRVEDFSPHLRERRNEPVVRGRVWPPAVCEPECLLLSTHEHRNRVRGVRAASRQRAWYSAWVACAVGSSPVASVEPTPGRRAFVTTEA